MNPQSEHRHEIRRVVLPSGKTIEIIYFGESVEIAEAPGAAPQPTRTDLHRCPDCTSELVHPVAWEEVGPDHWQIELRCPNCHWEDTDVFHHDDVERFDETLDRGTQVLVRDLRQLAHANMEEQIERFTTALLADHILPEDF